MGKPLKAVDGQALRATMGARVRLARRTLDLTQGELAAVFGRTHGWLGPIEAGKVFPPPDLIATLQAGTAQPYSWFFGLGPDVTPAQPE